MKKKKNRFPGFELVTSPESEIVTFGTNVWIRKNPIGVIIVFPAGQTLKILPEEEIAGDDNPNNKTRSEKLLINKE